MRMTGHLTTLLLSMFALAGCGIQAQPTGPQRATDSKEYAMPVTHPSADRDTDRLSHVRREAGKVWIEGVAVRPTSQRASSVHGAQASILECLGEDTTYEDLVCYGGFAFRVGWHEQGCPSAGHPCCGYMCVARSDEAVPWTITRYDSFPWDVKKMSAEEVTARQAEIRAAVKDSIDRGVPVHVQAEEDGLIVGYADDGARWLCLHPYHQGGREMYWYDQAQGFAGGPDQWPWVVQIMTGPKPPAARRSDRELTTAALQQAVAMWHSPDAHEHHYYCGDKAYEKWLGWLRSVEAGDVADPRSGMQGNGWCFDVLIQSRRIAGPWLRQKAHLFSGETQRAILLAADHYDKIAPLCLEGCVSPWDIALPPSKADQWTSRVRQTQIIRLEAARQHDAAAIAAIEAALSTLPADQASGRSAAP